MLSHYEYFLANLSKSAGILNHGKKANVKPNFKKCNNSYPSNCVGKVMERVVYKYVYNRLQGLKLIYEFQSGFKPKHSTVH